MSRTATPRDLIPEAHCVLGTMLRPFSLGHHLLLERIASPFAGDWEIIAPPDQLALAVFLCAAPYPQTLDAIIRGDLADEHARWTAKLKPRFWQRNRFDRYAESEKFSAYLKDGYRRAPICTHGGSGIDYSAPWECLLKCRLIASGFNEADVMQTYMPAAWYHYHTLREIQQMEDYNPRFGPWRKVFWTERDDAAFRRIPEPAPN